MRVVQQLIPEQVLLGVDAQDKWALLECMFEAAWRSLPRLGATAPSREETWQRLVDGERLKASGFGRGLAFPHVSCARLAVPGLCIALPNAPVDFDSLDGTPAEIVCLILVPEDHKTSALRIISLIAGLCSERECRELIRSADDPAAICHLVLERAQASDLPILARDIMRIPYLETRPETPLREVTMKMLRHNLDAVAVLSREGEVLGEITCNEMLVLGLPDFFKQLKSVSFIRDFDPFEKYFDKHADLSASQVMSSHFACLDEEATLLEVVFELAMLRHPKVYVTRDGKLAGVIDRFLLLDKILNL